METNDIGHGDFNNDGKVEILAGTVGFQFYVFEELNDPGKARTNIRL